ncbi:MAG: glycerophosphodiester phosphodiesterase [Actinomycetota bacterium]|nr:glycerophosphodiester phosphodiesterase [Actinomycetota bacterium]
MSAPRRYLAAIVVVPVASATAAPSPDVVDVAHRGSSGSAPENTVAAVELAVDQQASFVEVDVQRSADDELVIVHDTTLARTTDAEQVFPDRAPWNVGAFTLAELEQLDAGSWYAPEFADEPIPTLADVIDSMGRKSGLLLELKSPELYPGIEAQVVDELSSDAGWLRKALKSEQLVVQSFDHASMKTFDSLAPQIPTGLLFGYRPTTPELVAASSWAEQINPSYRVTDQALVEEVQASGMTISVYTLNTGRLMREFIALDVDGIITDYPVVLRDILANQERSAA